MGSGGERQDMNVDVAALGHRDQVRKLAAHDFVSAHRPTKCRLAGDSFQSGSLTSWPYSKRWVLSERVQAELMARTVAHLTVELTNAAARINADPTRAIRPIIPIERHGQSDSIRTPLYRKVASFTVTTEYRTPDELFRVGPATVTRWEEAGKLRSVRTPGGHRQYPADDVEALITRQTDSGSS